MNKIPQAFEKPGAFIAFLTAGDPDLETTKKCIHKLVQAGTDLIEIGVPFSDPCAEGPVIERADTRALEGGFRVVQVFDLIRELREENVDVPLVLMTYYNPVFKYGNEAFIKKLKEAGGDGLIVPDMPYEESDELKAIARKHGLDLISMVAPTSNERIKEIASDAGGFLYVVSSLGVTGVRSNITTDIGAMIKKVKEVTDTPTAVGFGVSTPEQARKMCESADGVIVGSAIVKLIEKYGKDAPEYVYDYAKKMKDAAADRIL